MYIHLLDSLLHWKESGWGIKINFLFILIIYDMATHLTTVILGDVKRLKQKLQPIMQH